MADAAKRDLEAELRDAIGQSDATEVRRLIAAGANVNGTGEYGWSMLHLASFGGVGPEAERVQPLQLLLDAGAVVDARDEWDNTPLMWAAGDGGDAARVRCVIAAGADVNAATPDGWTALMTACDRFGAAAGVGLLLAAGADVHARTRDGWSALMLAVRGWPDAAQKVRALLQAGADTRVVDDKSVSLMDRARAELLTWTLTKPPHSISQKTQAYRAAAIADAQVVVRLLEATTRRR